MFCPLTKIVHKRSYPIDFDRFYSIYWGCPWVHTKCREVYCIVLLFPLWWLFLVERIPTVLLVCGQLVQHFPSLSDDSPQGQEPYQLNVI